MRRPTVDAAVSVPMPSLYLAVACVQPDPAEVNARPCLSLSRFTDPGDRSVMLDELPEYVTAIAEAATLRLETEELDPYSFARG